MTTTQTHPDQLLVTAPEAARMLSISARTLWSMTASGQIPCVRIGRAVRYDVMDLYDLIAHRKGERQ